MKLHIFEAVVNDIRVRAFTRDRAGRVLRGQVEMHSLGIVVRALDWKYKEEVRINGHEASATAEIIERIKRDSVAFRLMPRIPRTFFVFDVAFDDADVRIYSSDRELREFREYRRRLELGTHGYSYISDPEVFVDQIEIPSKHAAAQMGIDDYDGLITRGFVFAITRKRPETEQLERALLRELKKKTRFMGIEVLSVKVDKIVGSERSDGVVQISDHKEKENVLLLSQSDLCDTKEQEIVRSQLLKDFSDLNGSVNNQARGYALERFLNRLFTLEGLQPRQSFRIVGEQIDGSFSWRNRTHLVEAKWQTAPIGGAEFGAFDFKLNGKTADTRGLFIAINGYSQNGLKALHRKGDLKFVCLDKVHIEAALAPGSTLRGILDVIWRHADETGVAYHPGPFRT